jgi:N-formylglutamate amidohydrolase
MKPVFSFRRGTTPLLVSIPHAGTAVPADIRPGMTGEALKLPDTDWFVDRLYDWVIERGAGLLVANYSRYVIDLNRPPDDAALYSGPGTGLLPVQLFDGGPLYRQGANLGATQSPRRLARYWKPYHEKLAAELKHIREQFGHAILLDAHSIRAEVPRLFEGRLPDLNLGSNSGASADSGLIAASFNALAADGRYSAVLDGRFKGGYITRQYGKPLEHCHALQLEMSQSIYMREEPPVYDPALASKVQAVLHGLVDVLLGWAPS